ncbi:uncharacterized protein LOC115447738 [Manduca sexta]|uniref:uncharacterized protein LOC115447738 n=1 Tax=Manduca sexta TaxID=7130 RepID=UPI0018904095|nr:uncharacterized protein LOC115447738 [Manduca sexta]
MGLEFEGATDNISERQLSFISEVLEKRGYKDTKVTIGAVGEAGDNFVAFVKRIIVRDDNGEFRMIAKFAPQIEIHRMSTQSENLFKNEHIIYTVVLPKFQQLEEEANVPQENRLRFAECYGSLSEPPHEVILLEDLRVPDFIMLDRFKPLPEECIRSVLRNFATLHSLSFALKHKDLNTFNVLKNGFFDLWASMDGGAEAFAYFSQLENSAASIVEGEERKKLLKGCIINALAATAKMSKQDEDSKHSIIQQGDSWTNNIMFKFDRDTLQESVMIDYQLSKVSNPCCDIMYLIFNCTDHKTRLQHFHDWIDYYHSELVKALSNFGLEANVYPREQLDADMEKIRKYNVWTVTNLGECHVVEV